MLVIALPKSQDTQKNRFSSVFEHLLLRPKRTFKMYSFLFVLLKYSSRMGAINSCNFILTFIEPETYWFLECSVFFAKYSRILFAFAWGIIYHIINTIIDFSNVAIILSYFLCNHFTLNVKSSYIRYLYLILVQVYLYVT